MHKHKLLTPINITLLALVLVTMGVRLWFISDHYFNFFFDQSRDAIAATRIAHGDLAIYGPSASGTQDTIYHGVIWYYFLAPFYAFTADPQLAVSALAIFSSLYLVVIYHLTRKLFHQHPPQLLCSSPP